MNRNLDQTTLDTLKALGYQVFMTTNPHFQTYCFYVDGNNIGYMENGLGGLTLSSVHMPNRQTGTGFRMGEGNVVLTRGCLNKAFAAAPSWASSSDRESVRKYSTLEEFLKNHSTLVRVR
jgi:hypothetical protein